MPRAPVASPSRADNGPNLQNGDAAATTVQSGVNFWKGSSSAITARHDMLANNLRGTLNTLQIGDALSGHASADKDRIGPKPSSFLRPFLRRPREPERPRDQDQLQRQPDPERCRTEMEALRVEGHVDVRRRNGD